MSRPGVEIISSELPPPRSAPTDTGVWFVVGQTGIGPVEPTLIRSLSQYVNTYGDRSGGTVLYDAVDAYFREGGVKLYVRALPTTPTVMTAGDGLSADELNAMTRDELNTYAADHGVAEPEGLSTKADVVQALGAGEAPSQQTAPTSSQIIAALDDFDRTLGPGQVSAPGYNTSDVHTALLQHAASHNRVALCEAASGQTAAQLVALAGSLRTLAQARYGSLWAPGAILPGLAPGTTRTVGFASVEAGLIARSDVSFNPNQPAAGVNGQSVYATDLSDRYTDAEYETLNEGGVDLARLVYDGVRAYGFRTLVDPDDPTWLSLGNARTNMSIVAQAEAVAERFLFSQLDGRGKTIAHFGAELRAMLLPFWSADALYGETADDAFQVDVGNQVNTPETIANGELHAVLKLRMSPFSEWVVIEIVKVATTQALAA